MYVDDLPVPSPIGQVTWKATRLAAKLSWPGQLVTFFWALNWRFLKVSVNTIYVNNGSCIVHDCTCLQLCMIKFCKWLQVLRSIIFWDFHTTCTSYYTRSLQFNALLVNNYFEIICNSTKIAFQSSTSSTQEHLCKLFKALESFYHPSNNGRYSVSTCLQCIHCIVRVKLNFIFIIMVIEGHVLPKLCAVLIELRRASTKLILIPDVCGNGLHCWFSCWLNEIMVLMTNLLATFCRAAGANSSKVAS